MHDVLNILTDGEIVEARVNDEGNFNCKISGLDIEGEPGGVVAEIVKKSKIIVITVLGGV